MVRGFCEMGARSEDVDEGEDEVLEEELEEQVQEGTAFRESNEAGIDFRRNSLGDSNP